MYLVIEDTQEIFDEWKGRQVSWCVPKIWLGFEYPIQHSLCVTGQVAACLFLAGISDSQWMESKAFLYSNNKISRKRELINCALLSLRSFRWHNGKESTCQCRSPWRRGFYPWVGKISWRGKWQLTPVFLPGECHGQRDRVGYSTWPLKELDVT